MNSKVNIVISTYNGEKYIKEQLDSLLAQSYENIEIYVRDDGSSDQTMQILETYKDKHGIHVYQGKNKGFAASFFDVLEYANEGDYWAFCDQDDIWYPNKIKLAVEWLDSQDQEMPLLYYSLSEMFDEKGSLGIQKPPKNSLCFRRAMTGTFGVGFSMVVNKRLRDEMLQSDPYRVHSHDWLAGAIALGFGVLHMEEVVCAKYRRLDTSVTKISFRKKVKWLCTSLKQDGDVRQRNIEFYKKYKEKLNSENEQWARVFGKPELSLKTQIKKVFYPKRWRPSMSSEIVMRCLMMLGKI